MIQQAWTFLLCFGLLAGCAVEPDFSNPENVPQSVGLTLLFSHDLAPMSEDEVLLRQQKILEIKKEVENVLVLSTGENVWQPLETNSEDKAPSSASNSLRFKYYDVVAAASGYTQFDPEAPLPLISSNIYRAQSKMSMFPECSTFIRGFHRIVVMGLSPETLEQDHFVQSNPIEAAQKLVTLARKNSHAVIVLSNLADSRELAESVDGLDLIITRSLPELEMVDGHDEFVESPIASEQEKLGNAVLVVGPKQTLQMGRMDVVVHRRAPLEVKSYSLIDLSKGANQ